MGEQGGSRTLENPTAAFAGEDPATDEPLWDLGAMLDAIAGKTHERSDAYPSMARTARDEGFVEIADRFETLAKAERSRSAKFTKARETLAD